MGSHIYQIILIRGCYVSFRLDWLLKLFPILLVLHNNQTGRERTNMDGCVYDEVGDGISIPITSMIQMTMQDLEWSIVELLFHRTRYHLITKCPLNSTALKNKISTTKYLHQWSCVYKICKKIVYSLLPNSIKQQCKYEENLHDRLQPLRDRQPCLPSSYHCIHPYQRKGIRSVGMRPSYAVLLARSMIAWHAESPVVDRTVNRGLHRDYWTQNDAVFDVYDLTNIYTMNDDNISGSTRH